MKLVFEEVRVATAHFDIDVHATLTADRLALFGRSGAGKSSLLDAIAGLAPLAHGRITLDGRLLASATSHVPLSERRVGYVPQDAALFRRLSVEKNIYYARPSSERAELAKKILDRLELHPLLPQRAARLSGGEGRRVAIARALLADATLLLLDEPFNGLDEAMKSRVIELVDETAVPRIVVTHERAEALALADEVLVLERGEVAGHGRANDILATV